MHCPKSLVVLWWATCQESRFCFILRSKQNLGCSAFARMPDFPGKDLSDCKPRGGDKLWFICNLYLAAEHSNTEIILWVSNILIFNEGRKTLRNTLQLSIEVTCVPGLGGLALLTPELHAAGIHTQKKRQVKVLLTLLIEVPGQVDSVLLNSQFTAFNYIY